MYFVKVLYRGQPYVQYFGKDLADLRKHLQSAGMLPNPQRPGVPPRAPRRAYTFQFFKGIPIKVKDSKVQVEVDAFIEVDEIKNDKATAKTKTLAAD